MAERICGSCFESFSGDGPCPHCGWDDSVQGSKFPHSLKSGTVLDGRYILGRVLGQGGFGITYLAQKYKTKEKVAIKEYFPENMASRSGTTKVMPYSGELHENYEYGKSCFLDEAKTLAEFIDCPGVVGVQSYFEENGTAYFVMEYLEGKSLQAYLNEHGRLTCEEAFNLLSPIMDALQTVHSHGVIHRDVTPDNIMITDSGAVKLLDFGAARYNIGNKTRSMDVVLKHGFAPREQYSRHGKQGPYTDIYSFAATFYYALTLRIPPDSVDRQDSDELVLPSTLGVKISYDMEDALLKGLELRSEDRYSSMGEFKAALASALEPENKKSTVIIPDSASIPVAEKPDEQEAVVEDQPEDDAVPETKEVGEPENDSGKTVAVDAGSTDDKAKKMAGTIKGKLSALPGWALPVAVVAIVALVIALAVLIGVLIGSGSSKNDPAGIMGEDMGPGAQMDGMGPDTQMGNTGSGAPLSEREIIEEGTDSSTSEAEVALNQVYINDAMGITISYPDEYYLDSGKYNTWVEISEKEDEDDSSWYIYAEWCEGYTAANLYAEFRIEATGEDAYVTVMDDAGNSLQGSSYGLRADYEDFFGEIYFLPGQTEADCYVLILYMLYPAEEGTETMCREILSSFKITGDGSLVTTEFITDEDGYQYISYGDELTMVGYTGSVPDSGILVTPDTYDGMDITGIEMGTFTKLEGLKRVLLPLYIDEVPDGTFVDCPDLWNVNVYSRVEEIGEFSIIGCDSMRVIYTYDETLWEGVMLPDDCLIIEAGTDVGFGTIQGSFALVDNVVYGLTSEDVLAVMDVPSDTTVLNVENTVNGYTVNWIWSGALDHADSLTTVNLGSYSCYDYSLHGEMGTVNYNDGTLAATWVLNCDIADTINEGRGYDARHIRPDVSVVLAAETRASEIYDGYTSEREDGRSWSTALTDLEVDWTWAKEFWDDADAGDYTYSEIYDFVWNIVETHGLINTQTEEYYNKLGIALYEGTDYIVCAVLGVY